MKSRIQLLGGLSFNSLRAVTASHDDLDGREIYDTWPIDDLMLDIFSRNFEDDYDVLAACVQMIAAGRTAKSLLQDAGAAGWEAGLADLDTDFHIDVPQKKILINADGVSPNALMRSPYFRHGLQIALVRALRDVWHEKRHGGFDEKFDADSILLLERTRAADCDIMTVLAAWEMRAEGYGDLWRHILASPESELAVKFSDTIEKAAARRPNYICPPQKALEVAFRAWHQDAARVDACDHETLEYIDAVRRGGNSLGQKKAASADIEILSCLPDRTAYLQDCGADIIRNPLFAGLHDPVNQSHYVQVIHDLAVTYMQGVPFRDASLAAKIFPNGKMTEELETSGNR